MFIFAVFQWESQADPRPPTLISDMLVPHLHKIIDIYFYLGFAKKA